MTGFPPTHPSAISGLRSADPKRRARSREVVANAYWKPIYKYLRLQYRMEPAVAEDVVQGFFERTFAGDMLASYEPERARFRTFLRRCLDHYAVDQHRRSTTQARGAGIAPLELAAAESELTAASPSDPGDVFDREWLRHVMTLAVERLMERLAKQNKPVHAELFRRFHLTDEPPAYDDVARELGIKVTDVTNWLHAARRELRRVALELLRELTANEDEFADEAQAVFGIDVRAKP